MANKRPGVMLYFEMRPALAFLSREEKGALLDAILSYADDGETPELDGTCAVVWTFLQRQLDRDRAAYDEKCCRSRYAVYCRIAKQAGETPLPYGSWLAAADGAEGAPEELPEDGPLPEDIPEEDDGLPDGAPPAIARHRTMGDDHPDDPTTTTTTTGNRNPTGIRNPIRNPAPERIPAPAGTRNRSAEAFRSFEAFPQAFAQAYPQLGRDSPQFSTDCQQTYPQAPAGGPDGTAVQRARGRL